MLAQGNNLRLRDQGGSGAGAAPGPENEDSQHMLKQPREYFSGFSQGRKRNPNPNFFGPDIFGWGGGLPLEGVGQKVRYVLRNPGKPNFLAGCPGILPGYPAKKTREKFEKKRFVFNSRPLKLLKK